jgi:hypothetical protein
MSTVGTFASILGGALVGVLAGVSLVAENAQCKDSATQVLLSTVLWGTFSGFFGSLVRSHEKTLA